jgi:hypothetical protein
MDKSAISKFVENVKRTLGGKILRMGVRGGEVLFVVKNKDCLVREKIYDILYEVDPLDEFGMSIKIFSETEFETLKKHESEIEVYE